MGSPTTVIAAAPNPPNGRSSRTGLGLAEPRWADHDSVVVGKASAAAASLDPLERLLVQAGEVVALGEIAPGAAHEINNPLFAILGLVEFLIEDAEPGTKTRERLELIQQSAAEIKEIVKAMLDVAREPAAEIGVVSVEQVVRDILVLVRRTSLLKDVEIAERYGAGSSIVAGSAAQLRHAVLSLVVGAQQAAAGGSISVETACEDGWVTLAVAVRAPVPPGLGLALAERVARVHGGGLSVDVHDQGTRLVLRLPWLEARA